MPRERRGLFMAMLEMLNVTGTRISDSPLETSNVLRVLPARILEESTVSQTLRVIPAGIVTEYSPLRAVSGINASGTTRPPWVSVHSIDSTLSQSACTFRGGPVSFKFTGRGVAVALV